jgi:transcriptional regulator with XRE-family HTH domain
MSFADRLKEARRSCGLSQEDLAEQLDVSRQAVGKWEQGQAYPEVEKLLTLCGVLNTSLDALMADELPKNCRTNNSSPTPSESILIRGIHLVRCTSVMRSQPFRSRRGPKYFLYGVSGHSTTWGQHNTLLGWYADESSVNAEISAIQEAMRRGDADYTLQYAVRVRRRLGRIEMIDE